MSVFRNIRIYPAHGARTAVVTWSMADDALPGNVYLAFSTSGVPGSWTSVNPDTPVASSAGMVQDTGFVLRGAAVIGYYRLMLRNGTGDVFSEPVGILGDLTPAEYGVVRAIIHKEYTGMRAANGYPVWHCIPKDHGTPSGDPDTGEAAAFECPGTDPTTACYGMPFAGGFNRPLLTWIKVLQTQVGTLKDSEDGLPVQQQNTTTIRMMAFPQPSRGHMLVDPATDKRYAIGDEINPFKLRGVFPIAYETSMIEIPQADPRYRFPVPVIDTKAYRKLPYWSPV